MIYRNFHNFSSYKNNVVENISNIKEKRCSNFNIKRFSVVSTFDISSYNKDNSKTPRFNVFQLKQNFNYCPLTTYCTFAATSFINTNCNVLDQFFDLEISRIFSDACQISF